jgi:hypothetical protein
VRRPPTSTVEFDYVADSVTITTPAASWVILVNEDGSLDISQTMGIAHSAGPIRIEPWANNRIVARPR